jgi:lipoic acid synthetase
MQTSLTSPLRLPEHLRKSLRSFKERRDVYRVLRHGGLHTVCEEARCPNIGECFSQKTATFMIMGDRCTRRCHFCSVTTKKPLPIDPHEPAKLAHAASLLGLDYVVVTSVDRDELLDHGADHFVAVVHAIKEKIPSARIELLTPDFRGRLHLVDRVAQSPIDVFGHNIETVARLYKLVRPQSDYEITKSVLRRARSLSGPLVKSGLMVGLGESDDEILDTLAMLNDLGVEIVTIGQYLRPSLKHWPVARYVADASYERFREHGHKIGLRYVFAGPFVRSSYHAKEAHDLTRA